jgi:hypothetical protein
MQWAFKVQKILRGGDRLHAFDGNIELTSASGNISFRSTKSYITELFLLSPLFT